MICCVLFSWTKNNCLMGLIIAIQLNEALPQTTVKNLERFHENLVSIFSAVKLTILSQGWSTKVSYLLIPLFFFSWINLEHQTVNFVFWIGHADLPCGFDRHFCCHGRESIMIHGKTGHVMAKPVRIRCFISSVLFRLLVVRLSFCFLNDFLEPLLDCLFQMCVGFCKIFLKREIVESNMLCTMCGKLSINMFIWSDEIGSCRWKTECWRFFQVL